MSDEKESEDSLLVISEVCFRYKKKEMTSWDYQPGYFIRNNPSCDEAKYKGRKEEKEEPIFKNEDWHIWDIEKLLKVPTIESSLRIWKTLSKASNEKLRATYIPSAAFKKDNPNPDDIYFPSRIVHLLRVHAWIPDNYENFHKPADILLEDINDDFEYEGSERWLREIGVINLSEQKNRKAQAEKSLIKETQKEKESAAQILGFTMEEVDFFTAYKKILENKIGKFVDIFEIENK